MALLFRHRRHHRRHSLLLRAVAAATSSSTSNSNKSVLVAQQSQRMKRLFPSSSSSSSLPLTRYQKLRLSPRERDIYLRYQILIHNKSSNKKSSSLLLSSSSSSSLLESARSNARFNLQYLKSNANTNLRKNIQTMKRLFNGEEVWKDTTPTTSTTTDGGRSASTTLSSSSSSSSSEADGLHLGNIDWERVPSEIMSNVKRNTTFLSEWIHDATGGKIPAFSRTSPRDDTTLANTNNTRSNNTNDTTGGGGGGSIATRIRNFHVMKRDDTTLVMDKYWIAKNILFALLPGLVLHLYFASLQDEMAEYYGKIERMERERILGIESTGGRSSSSRDGDGDGGSNVPPFKNECIRNREDKEKMMLMGISSALIPEGGDSWDKLKLVVNDLFLGGIEKKIIGRESVVEKEEKTKDEGKAVDEKIIPQVETASNASHGHSDSSSSLPVNQLAKQEEVPNCTLVKNHNMHHDDDDDDSNLTVQMLLERIRALEARIGNSSTAAASEEEIQRQRREEGEEEEHRIKRQVERVRQSPIKNRRDNVLEAKWKKEAKNDDDSSSTSSSGGNENDAGNGNILGVLVGMVEMLSLAPYLQSVKESVVKKLRKIESLGFPSTLLPHSYDDDNNDDERESAVAMESDTESAVAMESDTVLTVDGNVGECVTSFSPVIDPSVDRHHDENDQAGRGHWVMNVWQRIRKSSPFCAVSEVEDDANGKEVMPGKNQSTSTN